MSDSDERGWLIVRNWKKFQHPDVSRSESAPIWIRNYTRLLHDEDYLGLTWQQRGTLHGLWLEYAASDGRLPDSTATISRRLGDRVTRATLNSLYDAGFIEFSASKPPRLSASLDKNREEEKDPPNPPAQRGGKRRIGKKELRGYTGCRQTRGTHGFGYKHETLGRDAPPSDWPHPAPTETEVCVALARQWIEDNQGGADEHEAKAMVVRHFGVNGDSEIALLDHAADLRGTA